LATLSQKRRKEQLSQKVKSGQNHIRKGDWHHCRKTEKWAKSDQKLKRNLQNHFNKGYNKKKNAKVNMKTTAKLHVKTNMNMTQRINKCDLEHESDDISKEG
jgi:hypothetical protein